MNHHDFDRALNAENETDPVIAAVLWLRDWLRDHFPKPGTLPLTCTLAALSLVATVMLVALIDLPAQHYPREIDSRPVPVILLLAWPAVWVPALAATPIPRLRTVAAAVFASTTLASLVVGPVLAGSLSHLELVAAFALVALNGAGALATLNPRMLTWVLSICTLVLLAWGSSVVSIVLAHTAGGYGALWAVIYWEGTILVVLALGMLALWSAGRFWVSLGYLVASPVVNFLWVVAQLGMARLAPWLVIPLALLLNGAYIYLAWRFLLARVDNGPRTGTTDPALPPVTFPG
jgi:hypothetical protein